MWRSVMKRSIGVFLAGIVISFILILGIWGIKHKLGIRKIESAVSNHKKIDIAVLIKEAGVGGQYAPLTEESITQGMVNLTVEPLDDNQYTYVEYKINGFNYATGYGPSYEVEINAAELPDGWNQLLAIGYEEGNQLKGVKQIIFKVKNSSGLKARAPRSGRVYGKGEVPVYKSGYIPVLMYHDFRDEITTDQESAIVHPDLFDRQLQVLLENGYTPINFNDLNLYMNGEGGLPPMPIIITSDDGYLSNYEVAFPILKKHKVPATFFVTTRYVGVDTQSPHFTWEQAKEMEASGLIDIQSHTHGHMLLNTIPDDEMRHQVDVSFGIIEQNLGKRDVKALAYPQFYCNNHTKEILTEENVDLQITRLAQAGKASTEPTNIQRIHVANYTSPEDLLQEINNLTQ